MFTIQIFSNQMLVKGFKNVCTKIAVMWLHITSYLQIRDVTPIKTEANSMSIVSHDSCISNQKGFISMKGKWLETGFLNGLLSIDIDRGLIVPCSASSIPSFSFKQLAVHKNVQIINTGMWNISQNIIVSNSYYETNSSYLYNLQTHPLTFFMIMLIWPFINGGPVSKQQYTKINWDEKTTKFGEQQHLDVTDNATK